jgi:hypothetical protein
MLLKSIQLGYSSGMKNKICRKIVFLLISWLFLFSCQSPQKLERFNFTAAAGSSGSLVVYGECGVPDGTLLLVHAQGGHERKLQVETAILASVVRGRFTVDLNLYETEACRPKPIIIAIQKF